MASLSQFQSTIAGSDVARSNRFEAFVSGPSGSADFATMMLVESVEFPGQTIRTTPDLLRFGPQREIGQAAMYADSMTMTFICRPGLPEKMYFEKWQNSIFDRGSWEVNYYADYIGEITLHQLDKKDSKRYSVRVYEAYPKTITAQTFNAASNDSYQTLSVEFAFRYWESKPGSAGGLGGGLGGGLLGGLGGGLGGLIGGAALAALSGGTAGLKSFAANQIGAAIGAKGLVQGLMSGASKKVMAKDMLAQAITRGSLVPRPSGLMATAFASTNIGGPGPTVNYSKFAIVGSGSSTSETDPPNA
tara:strand:- start:68 stop:976 length:909 start_codon:yes stop_codon:yes gene_type:complete